MRTRPAVIGLIASLEGAAGVALAAVAAHIRDDANVRVASLFLMVHAGAGLALGALAAQEPRRLGWLVGAALALLSGVALFSTDLAWRAFHGDRLFPYAAPIGGSLAILAWLALAAWALALLLAPPRAASGSRADAADAPLTEEARQ